MKKHKISNKITELSFQMNLCVFRHIYTYMGQFGSDLISFPKFRNFTALNIHLEMLPNKGNDPQKAVSQVKNP